MSDTSPHAVWLQPYIRDEATTDTVAVPIKRLAYLEACEREVEAGRSLGQAHDDYEAGIVDSDEVMVAESRFEAARLATDRAREEAGK